MPKRNSTVKIVDGKVVLSDEVLNIIESWRTEENSEWVDKYLEIISDPSNIGSKKSRGHHIIPCFVFKDETHKNRKETEPLADKIKENIIELSVENHLFAHNFLRLIFPNNKDARISFQRMSKETNIEDLTEERIIKIAKLLEECVKENVTKEKRTKQRKEYYKNNKDILLQHSKDWYKNNKERKLETTKKWKENNKEKWTKYNKEYAEENKERIKKYSKEYNEKNKEKRHKKSKEYYEHNKEEISKKHKEYRNKNKEKIHAYQKEYRKNNKEKTYQSQKRWRENNKEKNSLRTKQYYNDNKEKISQKHKDYGNQLCYDPKRKGEICTLSALRGRKTRNKELYKDIIPQNCIIKKNISD